MGIDLPVVLGQPKSECIFSRAQEDREQRTGSGLCSVVRSEYFMCHTLFYIPGPGLIQYLGIVTYQIIFSQCSKPETLLTFSHKYW